MALKGQWRFIVSAVAACGAAFSLSAAEATPGLYLVSDLVSGLVSGSVSEQRTVDFFFSDAAWGGVPFTEAQKQEALVGAMTGRKPVRLEAEVIHLLNAPDARVRRFTAVFEVDGSAAPPTVRSGYELELLVPYSREPLSVELENAETGVVNRVEVDPGGL